MARRRMIDPNIWQSEDFSKLSTLAKLVFIGLFSQADDEGRGRAKPIYIKSILFPYDEKVRLIDIETALSEIALNLSVTFYSADNGNEYYCLDNWENWQTIDKPKPSKIPSPKACKSIPVRVGDESATNPRRVGDEYRLKEKKGKEGEGKGNEGNEARARKSYGTYGWIKLTDEEYSRLLNELGPDELKRCIAYVDESAQATGNKNKWRDWNLVLRKCHRDGWGRAPARKAAPLACESTAKVDYTQLERVSLDSMKRWIKDGEP